VSRVRSGHRRTLGIIFHDGCNGARKELQTGIRVTYREKIALRSLVGMVSRTHAKLPPSRSAIAASRMALKASLEQRAPTLMRFHAHSGQVLRSELGVQPRSSRR